MEGLWQRSANSGLEMHPAPSVLFLSWAKNYVVSPGKGSKPLWACVQRTVLNLIPQLILVRKTPAMQDHLPSGFYEYWSRYPFVVHRWGPKNSVALHGLNPWRGMITKHELIHALTMDPYSAPHPLCRLDQWLTRRVSSAKTRP